MIECNGKNCFLLMVEISGNARSLPSNVLGVGDRICTQIGAGAYDWVHVCEQAGYEYGGETDIILTGVWRDGRGVRLTVSPINDGTLAVVDFKVATHRELLEPSVVVSGDLRVNLVFTLKTHVDFGMAAVVKAATQRIYDPPPDGPLEFEAVDEPADIMPTPGGKPAGMRMDLGYLLGLNGE